MATPIPSTDEIAAMTDAEFKVFENRLRRAAERQGLRLEKSRRRDPNAIDFGRYALIDPTYGGAVHDAAPWGIHALDAEDVAIYLWGDWDDDDEPKRPVAPPTAAQRGDYQRAGGVRHAEPSAAPVREDALTRKARRRRETDAMLARMREEMMAPKPKCTCGHRQLEHDDGTGQCRGLYRVSSEGESTACWCKQFDSGR